MKQSKTNFFRYCEERYQRGNPEKLTKKSEKSKKYRNINKK
jgi:hypothetical protein